VLVLSHVPLDRVDESEQTKTPCAQVVWAVHQATEAVAPVHPCIVGPGGTIQEPMLRLRNVVGGSRRWRYAAQMSPESSGFVNPRDALEQEYQRALEQLRRELGDPKTLRERWAFWRVRRRLWREKVIRPSRSASW
jgi:hypothetical protein